MLANIPGITGLLVRGDDDAVDVARLLAACPALAGGFNVLEDSVFFMVD